MTFSVIMMSYLGHYPGARRNPIPKFNRSVQSFVNQTFKDCELIIVSDGCELTNQEYEANWANHDNITLIKTEKSKDAWPGVKRQLAREIAKGEWIIYLDSDDVYNSTYLELVASQIDNKHDVMFNDIVLLGDERVKMKKHVEIKGLYPPVSYVKVSWKETASFEGKNESVEKNGRGTCGIIHRNLVSSEWKNLEVRGEDTIFAKDLANTQSYKTVTISGYIVCHDPRFKRNPWESHLDI